ncbi:MAG: phosphatase 2C-like domain-containing protein [Monoraphidium minutum]|nr:MAG: phosphatase 2C-like domain-containing protein [Monoraphidium minutum]
MKWWDKLKSKLEAKERKGSGKAIPNEAPPPLVSPPAPAETDDRTGLSRPRGMGGRKSFSLDTAPGSTAAPQQGVVSGALSGSGGGAPPAHASGGPTASSGLASVTEGAALRAGADSTSPRAVAPQQPCSSGGGLGGVFVAPAPASPRGTASPLANGVAAAGAGAAGAAAAVAAAAAAVHTLPGSMQPAGAGGGDPQQQQAQAHAHAPHAQQQHRASLRPNHGGGSGEGREGHAVPRDEDLGSCPPFGTKAVWGLRYTMEDKWAAVPNMVAVPADYAAPASRGQGAPGAAAAACGCISGLARGSGGSTGAKRRVGGGGDGDGGGGGGGDEREALVEGSRSHRPDAAAATDALHYFGVYDGHGGAEAAKHCAARMHHVLLECIRAALDGDEAAFAAPPRAPTPPPAPPAASPEVDKSGHSSASSGSPSAPPPPAPPPPLLAPAADGEWLQAVLARAFVSLDLEFAAVSEGSYVGTTAVVVLLSSQRMWVAHCGDSRAVLGRGGAAMALTQDHKASRDDEVARVQAAGGHVWWDRVMGELAVSRAIGDHCLRPYVIPEPEVCMLERSLDDECLILASDGLWDVLENQEAADMALHRLRSAEAEGLAGVAAARKAASALTKAALERGTRDNVTVLVVDMRHERAAAGAGATPAAAAASASAAGGGGSGHHHASHHHAGHHRAPAAPASSPVPGAVGGAAGAAPKARTK